MVELGTALSAAQTLFAALECSLLKEAYSVSKYESDLEGLKRTVTTIKSVLVVAGNKAELSQTDLDYIQKLKDAVYDADDLFDKFITIAARNQNGGFSDKVRHFFSNENPIKVAHSIFKDVKKIRTHLDAIADDRNKFGFSVDIQPLRRRREETCSYVYANNVVGRDGDTTNIIHRLLDSTEDVGFLTIVGIGGLGKTTLAKLVYGDKRIVSDFPVRLWVCVADQEGSRFDVKEILSKMLELLGCQVGANSTIEKVQTEYQRNLGGKKLFLVLDDIWTENKLEWLRLKEFFMSSGIGSRIIVTTRSMETARIIGNDIHTNTYELQGLSEEDSWHLFEMLAFGKGPKHPKFDDIGKKIVQKCRNLPLAIKVVGSLLYGQSIDKWEAFETNGFVGSSNGKNEVMSVLKFSYDQLEPSLKSCFTYCAIFPKDLVIDKENLLNLWDAQGYIVPFDNGQSIESARDEHFSILLKRCFFQDAKKDEYGDIKSVKIHDLMHDLAQTVSESEIFIANSGMFRLKSSTCHVFETKDGFYENNDIIKNKIRSYLKVGGITSLHISKIVKNWHCLRTLSLEYEYIKRLPDTMGNLMHLRYLNLSNSSIKKLPSSIVKLHNLQTLNLNNCTNLKELPKKFSKLVNLTHFYIFKSGLEYMPVGMIKMSGLRVLTKFVVKDESLSGKQLVGQLSDLKALVVNLKGCINICFRRHFTSVERDWEESVIEGAEHLKFVRITFSNEDYEERVAEETIMKRLQPHPNLKKFELYNYKGKTINGWGSAHDNWATILPNLVEINLLRCYRLQQLPLLSEMLHLKHLYLEDLRTLEYMEEVSSRSSESKFTFFPSLETLEIRNCGKLKGWSRGQDRSKCQLAFPRLSGLTIGRCSEMTSFPACPSLHSLDLLGNNKALRITTTDEGQSSSSSPLLSCYNEKSSTNPDSGNTNVGLFTVDHIAHLKPVASPLVTRLEIWDDNEVESLSEVDEMCKRCSSLKSLDIWRCSKLTSFCGGLEHLTALHSLILRQCDVLKLEEGEHGDDGNGMPWRALHSSLRSLALFSLPKVEELPMGMQYLTSLQHLHIENCNNLKEIPEWVGCLPSLQFLTIRHCHELKAIPDGCLQSLQSLTIWDCHELKLEEEESWRALHSSLRSLTLSSLPKVEVLPMGMQYLTSLQHLKIHDCRNLKEIPEWVGCLQSLQSLHIWSCNAITSLPDAITSLQKLSISSCQGLKERRMQRAERTGLAQNSAHTTYTSDLYLNYQQTSRRRQCNRQRCKIKSDTIDDDL